MTMTETAPTLLLQDAFRMAMGNVATPVSIVTAYEDGMPHGTTVSAFASLSMNPPMILVSLDRRSELLEIVRRVGTFGVNVLGAHQSATASVFARKGVDRFADVDWALDAGAPRLDGSSGWVACELHTLVDGGDHEIAIGTVLRAEHADVAPLTYHQRLFGTHLAHD
ncbi:MULTISPECIES: flavin reductase family protein [unclassified Salinibacterium]|uniref:flavin reductase family protein n=1 Tax=unclassified Salinibacterium TaxID=2632331 RepID=UPI001AB04A65|nr:MULTISPECIES: flavin reductase family protein [unclassified Salinibacterium]